MKDYCGISDVCFSLPTVIDRGGIEKAICLKLAANEIEQLRRSAEILRETTSTLDLGN